MPDPITRPIARMIRSAPDTKTVEGSEDLAERVVLAVRALDEEPELEEVNPLRPVPLVRVDPVKVDLAARRIRHLVQDRELGEDSHSATRRFFSEVVKLLEEVGAYVVGVAIEKVRKELEGDR